MLKPNWETAAAKVCLPALHYAGRYAISAAAVSQFGSNMHPENTGTWSSFTPQQQWPRGKCCCHQAQLPCAPLCSGDTMEPNHEKLQQKQHGYLHNLMQTSTSFYCSCFSIQLMYHLKTEGYKAISPHHGCSANITPTQAASLSTPNENCCYKQDTTCTHAI